MGYSTTVRLFDPVDNSELFFATNPQEVTTSTSSEDASIALDAFGTLTRPMGRAVTTYSWSGVFYGAARSGGAWVAWPFWRSPTDCQYQLDTWHDGQPRRSQPLELEIINGPLRLLKPVYISSLSFHYVGAFYDLGYDLGLTEWRNVLVATWSGSAPAEGEIEEQATAQDPDTGAPPAPAEYVVKPGDTLWQISEEQLGDGARYEEIYDLNQDVIGDDVDNLVVGSTLYIPGGTAAIDEPTEPSVLDYDDLVGAA